MPEKKYEIRAEEYALDIQVHNTDVIIDHDNNSLVNVHEFSKINNGYQEKIFDLLSNHPGIKAKEIAKQINTDSSIVNEILNSEDNQDKFSRSSDGSWYVKNKIKKPDQHLIQKKHEDTNEDDYPDFGQHIYLMNEAKKAFKNRSKFSIIENYNKGFSVRMNNVEFFKLVNYPNGEYVRITMKGKYLNSFTMKNDFEYSYSKLNKEFGFIVNYGQLVSTLTNLSMIEKVRSVNDEELIKELDANIVS